MSLTSQLADPASPLSCFLDRVFPRLDSVAAKALAQLSPTPQAVPDRGTFTPWATTGTAIDHRLRLAFTPCAVPAAHQPETAIWCNPITTGIEIAADTAACHAADPRSSSRLHAAATQQASRRWQRIATLGQALAARLGQMAARTCPHENADLVLQDPDEAEMCRMCYAGAWFDELAHRPGEDHKILNFIGENDFKNLDEVLAVVPRRAIDDMVRLAGLAARSDLGVIRARIHPSEVTAGPLFAGGGDIGGADGDLIIAGTLIDIKTTMHPHRQLPAGLRQLLGYLLLDYDDWHAITGIGLYLARQGKLCTWELAELLPSLGTTTPLQILRSHCAEILRDSGEDSPVPAG